MKKHIVIIATMLLLAATQISAKDDVVNNTNEEKRTGVSAIVTMSSGVTTLSKNSCFGRPASTFVANVTDEDGNPAIGASILILGTTKGANIKVNGIGTVPNLIEGTHEIKISSVGYDPLYDTIQIEAGDTLKKSYKLDTDDISSISCFFTCKRMVDKYEIGSVTTFSAAEIQRSPAADRKLFNIRDDRNNDVEVLIDGIDVGNQFIDNSNYEDTDIIELEDVIIRNNGSKNNNLTDYIKLFPNPTDGYMALELEELFENLFVLDMYGEILFDIEPKVGIIHIDLSDFPSGVYFLKYSKGGIWGSTQIQLKK